MSLRFTLAFHFFFTYFLGVIGKGPSHSSDFNESNYEIRDIIERDVAVIGGGATGTYAAVRLRDMNQSVIVVERDSELGGHTKSYTIPGTDIKVDYGLQGFNDRGIVHEFFERFNVPLMRLEYGLQNIDYRDFGSGEMVARPYNPPNFRRYKQQTDKYPYLEWGFDLPDPVPEDLLLPFGEFVEKHSLQEIVYPLFFFAQGMGDPLRLPTIYVLKYFDSMYMDCVQSGILVAQRRDNHEIYDRALEDLDGDVLLSSHVISSLRSSDESGVRLVVKTPTGQKLVKASKLLITIPPDMNNMDPFDLGDDELSLFEEFQHTGWYVGLVSNTTLPKDTVFHNANPNTDYNIPLLPDLYISSPTHVDGIYLVKYGSQRALPDNVVQNAMVSTISRLSKTVGDTNTRPDVQLLAYQSHVPFELYVSPEAIRNGFYRNLTNLQGKRNTWYTGGTFHVFRAASMWNFTESLLPRMLGKN